MSPKVHNQFSKDILFDPPFINFLAFLASIFIFGGIAVNENFKDNKNPTGNHNAILRHLHEKNQGTPLNSGTPSKPRTPSYDRTSPKNSIHQISSSKSQLKNKPLKVKGTKNK